MDKDELILKYYANNARKLHTVVDSVLKNFGGITDRDHFYSLANEVFVHDILPCFDGESDFDAFVYSCLKKKICSEVTRINRERRMPYIRDGNGNKVKDDEGKYIRQPLLSLDAYLFDEDGEETYTDILEADYDLEETVMGQEKEGTKAGRYMSRLSKTQRSIVSLLVEGFGSEEITNILHITKKEYLDNLKNIRAYENISVLINRGE